jgi:nicotinate-nucleotide adenylyltransferase
LAISGFDFKVGEGKMRIGIFGGSFDPVHYGHLILAETCRESCCLDEVWFLPAATPPHKQGHDLSPASVRVDMLQLALGGHESMKVSTVEIDRGGISYTVETLRLIRQKHSEVELFLIIGADSLADLPTWREPREICELAIPLVVRRRGSPVPDLSVLSGIVADERLKTIAEHQIETPTIELSSTDLRNRAKANRSLRFRTPRAVEQFILENKLYAG